MRIVPFITLTVATLSKSTVLAEQLRPTEELNGLVLGEVKDGGFDNWMAECYEPLDDGWSNSCISGVLPCNTGSGIIFGKSNYQFIDKPQTKDAGGQCMVFGSNCALKNCVWPYDRAEEDELFAGNSTNPYPELLNLPSMVLFPKTAGDIVKGVTFANDNNIQVKVKSTGHSSFGDSTGSDALLINMRSMPKYADPDVEGGPTSIVECGEDSLNGFDDTVCNLAVARGMKSFAKVGGGQIFDELLRTINIWNDDTTNINKYHVLSGASGTVGTSGGWLQGGGLGLTQNGRTFGFGIDHVLAYEMVLPDGHHVRFGPTEWEDSEGYLQPKTVKVGGHCNTNPEESDESLWNWEECELSFEDLWFVTRGGGGGGWGIVTAVYYQLQDKPGDLEVTMFGPFSENVTEALTPVWVDFHLDFFSDPDSLSYVTTEESNSCGSYISIHTFVTLKQSTFFCFNGAGSVLTAAWKSYVTDRMDELLAAGMTQEEVTVASDNSRIAPFPTYPAFAGDLPPEFIMLQNVETPPGRVADLNPTIMVNRDGPNGMNMFQVPLSTVKDKKSEIGALITKISLSGKAEVYQMGGNHLIAQDQMNAMPQTSREAAFLLEVPNYEDQETLLKIIFGDSLEGDAFPGLYCHNIAMPNDYGPLKNDWTKPCPFDWSKEEKLEKCISFQEATWGTELLARLETIQSGLDPNSLFIQGYGVNGKGPYVGLTGSGATGASTISSCDDALGSPVVFGCSDNTLEFTFPSASGNQQCGSVVTVTQAANTPAIKLEDSEEDALYTVLLIDTTVSEVHPILHFGAVNVEGSSLKDGLSLTEIASFKPYHGPAPPAVGTVPGIEKVPFTYEFVIAAQLDSVEEPVLDTPINFDYESFLLENTDGEEMASSYFTTGHCVVLSTATEPNQSGSSGGNPVPAEPPTVPVQSPSADQTSAPVEDSSSGGNPVPAEPPTVPVQSPSADQTSAPIEDSSASSIGRFCLLAYAPAFFFSVFHMFR